MARSNVAARKISIPISGLKSFTLSEKSLKNAFHGIHGSNNLNLPPPTALASSLNPFPHTALPYPSRQIGRNHFMKMIQRIGNLQKKRLG
jgi:hypothetical protein